MKKAIVLLALLALSGFSQITPPGGGGGSGTFVRLSGDAASQSDGGATVVNGLKGVPFCTGYTPTNGQFVEYTTGGTPNPCYTAAAAGTISGLTANKISKASSATAITDSGISDNGTTVSTTEGIDFSGSSHTQPMRKGTASAIAASNCTQGETAFATDATAGQNIYECDSTNHWTQQLNSGSFSYPGAGIANSTGSAWGTSYSVGTAANNIVQLNGGAQLPAVSAANLTNWPTFNQSTTGTAAGLTSQYVDWSAGSGGASIANKPTLGTAASHAATDFQAALSSYSTIVGLWTTCSTGYLKYDGTCDTPSSGGVNWDAIGNPGGNLGLTMAARTTTFTHGATTGSSNMWTWTDTANNTGTGYMHYVNLASGSAMKPGFWAVNGNGVAVSNAGVLAKVGTGSVQADSLQGRAVSASAPSDTNTLCWTTSGNTWQPCAAGGGGTAVNVNGSSVSSPNFNGTTPTAQSGYTNGTFQVSGSSVSVEIPQRTIAASFLVCMGGCYANETTLVKWSAACGPTSTGTSCVDMPVTFVGCSIDAMTYPTGAALTVDVLASGTTTIFTSTVPTLADGSSAAAFQGGMAAAAVVHSQGWLTAKVLQPGSTVAGTGVNVVCTGTY